MRKAISFLLSFVILISCISSVTAYSAEKINAEKALEKIQTTKGFIPGKTAAVVGNCYGFASAVCNKLYGVAYNGEGLYGNYMCSHSTGNYYTVATYKNKSKSLSGSCAEDIMNFFINNAMPGDVIHYGTLTSGKSNNATHTFMIQSVDNDKLRIYHANYETTDYARADCHIDEIIWSSFLKNPTKTQYNSNGNMISLNAIFYNKMKKGGLGISINRYTKYTDKYNVVGPTIPDVSVSNYKSDSVLVKWNTITGASKYEVRYKKSSSDKYSVYSSSVKKTSCVVDDLSVGAKYYFKVRAYVDGKWKSYSKPHGLTALPPKVSKFTLSLDEQGIALSWKASRDATGYYIYRCNEPDGKYKKIKTLSDPDSTEYIDKSIEYGKKYYYKVASYKKVSSSYYTNSADKSSATYKIEKPKITVNRASTTSLKFTFTGDSVTKEYDYSITDSKGNTVSKGKTEDYCTVKDLIIGKTYTCTATAANDVGESDPAIVSKQALPPTPSYIKSSASKHGINVEYPKRNDINGYYIYRSAKIDGKYTKIGQVDDKSIEDYLDKSVDYNKKYYYKVKRYVVSDGKTYSGALSQATRNDAVIKIDKIEKLKAVRSANTAITISWKSDSFATEYRVSYRVAGKGKYTTAAVTNGTSYKINGLKLGTTYEFKVRGENSFGNGSYSKVISKKALPPNMDAPELTTSSKSIKVKWTPYSSSSGYRIYRKDSKNGSYKLIKTINSGKTSSFSDSKVKNGKTYYYRVQMFKKSGGKTYYSDKSAASSIKF